MLGWIIFALVLAVVGGVLTIVWWRVGDIWADEEHKRFRGGDDEPDPQHAGPMVVRGFDSTNDRPTGRPDDPDDNRPA
jgi:hypothetical protein